MFGSLPIILESLNMELTDRETAEWAFGKKIRGVSTGYTQVQGQVPKAYIELTTDKDSIRIPPATFTEYFEMGLGEFQTVCRLKDEQLRKAKIRAENTVIETVERRELNRLQEKYKDAGP